MDNKELAKHIRSKVEHVQKEAARGGKVIDTVSQAVADIMLAINLDAVARATADEMMRAMDELWRKGMGKGKDSAYE